MLGLHAVRLDGQFILDWRTNTQQNPRNQPFDGPRRFGVQLVPLIVPSSDRETLSERSNQSGKETQMRSKPLRLKSLRAKAESTANAETGLPRDLSSNQTRTHLQTSPENDTIQRVGGNQFSILIVTDHRRSVAIDCYRKRVLIDSGFGFDSVQSSSMD